MFRQTHRTLPRLAAIALGLTLINTRIVLSDEPADAEAPTVFELTVSPAAEPVPALKYHLLPPPEDLVRGNAAPIYLRVIWEQKPEWHKFIREESPRLLKFSLQDLPLEDAQKAVNAVSDEFDQFAAAAIRMDCNWEHVTEEDPMHTLLPDAQSMRTFSYALQLQVRLQTREKNPQGAVATLGNGLALASNVAKAPFLVTELVGLAISESMLSEADEVIACDGAPNLYWALAELPTPLISFRDGLGADSTLIRDRFPELRARDASIDWTELSQRMRSWAAEVARTELSPSYGLARKSAEEVEIHVSPVKLAAARSELPGISRFTPEQAAEMSDAEVEVQHTLGLHRVIYDQWRKWYYVPYDQLPEAVAEQTERLRAQAQERELYPLVSILAPLRGNLRLGQVRVQRLIARQQVIEALRMHAAAEGKFPQSLDEVKVVPVPVDPATGKPFAYELDAGIAVLDVEELLGMDRETLRLPVRITLRK